MVFKVSERRKFLRNRTKYADYLYATLFINVNAMPVEAVAITPTMKIFCFHSKFASFKF